MQFQRGTTNLKMVQQLESTKEADNSRMAFSILTMTQPTIFNDNPSSSAHVLGQEETLAQTRYLKSDTSSRRFMVGNEQVEDLTAIVEKCNVMGFAKPCLTLEKSAFSMRGMFGVPPQEYGMLSSSVDSIQSDNKVQVRREAGTIVKRAPEIFFSTEGGVEEEHRESLPRRRSISRLFKASSSVRESHIISERIRRNEMNELFAKMRSLLPKTKNDKASIIQETINYIQFLKQQLAIRSSKDGIIPKSSETVMSVLLAENRQAQPSESDGSNDNAGNGDLTVNFHDKNIFITINCTKKAKILPCILLVLEVHSIEVMDAFVSITDTGSFHCLHAQSVQILNPGAREILLARLNKFLKSDYKTYIGQQIQKRGN